MAKIYIPRLRTSHTEEQFLYKKIAVKLTALNHDVLVDEFQYGSEIELNFKNILNETDIIIPIITKETLHSKRFSDELIQLKNYSYHSRDNKLLIPIVDSDIDIDELPDALITINFLSLDSHTDYSFQKIVDKIDESINSFLGRRIATEEKAQEFKEKLEKKAPEYISETLSELNSREKYQRNVASLWYFLGFLFIVFGITVAYYFSERSLIYFKEKENWSLTIFTSLKSLFIIILLIASSKYCFNLGRSFMSESLKIADRIHAISFGKFYLQVFDQQLDANELKEIFRDWNINNQSSSFSNQATSDFDPKIFEKAIEMVDKIKNNDK